MLLLQSLEFAVLLLRPIPILLRRIVVLIVPLVLSVPLILFFQVREVQQAGLVWELMVALALLVLLLNLIRPF